MHLSLTSTSTILLSFLSLLTAVAGAPQAASSDSIMSSPASSVVPLSGALSSGSATQTSSTSSPSNSTSSMPSNCCCSDSPTSSNGTTSGLPSNGTSSNANGTSSGTQFVIYSDKWLTGAVPDVSKVEGYTVFALSFLLSTGPADQAQAWASLDDSTRKELKSKYNAAGIKIIVSAFGSTETPTTSGADATKVATTMADFVVKYGLDGIDVDYEDLGAMNNGDGKAEEWLTTFTKTLRSKLPKGKYLLTHAPVAPWFNSAAYKSGAYQNVHKNVGDMIDWYNIQFYNQNDYEDCDSLLTKSKTKTSVFEIASSGVDLNKLVIGKPATAADATNGFVDTKTLATCVSQAKQKGWNAGVMVWQYDNADSAWIKTVRGDAFPMSQ